MTVPREGTNFEREATAALHDIDTALRADGYSLHVTETAPDRLRVRIDASPEACAECLVPEQVMGGILETALGRAGVTVAGLEIAYPADAGDHAGPS